MPRIIDNDRDEIRAELDGREIRSWEYNSEGERRVKMRMAHEFAEGWFQATKLASNPGLDEALNSGDGVYRP